MFITTRLVPWMFSVGLMVMAAGLVSGQDYPTKPIRIITGGLGGGNDFVSRAIAQGVANSLGPMIVDNRTSGIAIATVSKAAPDGYILLATGNSFLISPLLEKVTYDPLKDFSPITLAASSTMVLVVHSSLPVKSVKELIALAQARPGELNYSTSQIGSGSQLAGEFFKVMAGVKMVRIPYTSASIEMADLLTGQVQLTFANAGAVTPQIKLGKIRAVAVTSLKPSALFPGLPTVAATLPGFEVVAQTAILGPAKTPQAIINRLNQEIVRAINTTETKERLIGAGIEAVGSSPEELANSNKSQIDSVSKLIKHAGIKLEN